MTIGDAVNQGLWVKYLVTEQGNVYHGHPDYEQKEREYLKGEKHTRNWRLVYEVSRKTTKSVR